MSRTWKDNAEEFAALDQGEGWPFAVLVACSVEKGKDSGVNVKYRPEKEGLSIGTGSKVSAGKFAEKAGTSTHRVLRYLAAWEKAAADGVVPDADTLSPSDAHNVPIPDERFGGGEYVAGEGGYYTAKAGGVSEVQVQRTSAETLVEKMTPEQRVEVATAIIEAVPEPEAVQIAEVADARVENDRELQAVVRGAQPVEPFEPVVTDPNPLVEGLQQEGHVLDLLDLVRDNLRLLKDALETMGALPETHPTANRIQTMWMDIGERYEAVDRAIAASRVRV